MQTFITSELLNPNKTTKVELKAERLIDYLLTYFPNGFDMPCTIRVNNNNLAVEDYDIKLNDGDVIILMFHQGIAGAPILVNLALSFLVSKIISKLFAPELPSQLSTDRASNAQASSVYSVGSNQNRAKLNQHGH